MKKKTKQQKEYVKITFLMKQKDIPQRKSPHERHRSYEEGLKQLLASIGIKNFLYEFGQFKRQPSTIDFVSSKSLRGKYFSSVFLPKPVKLKIKSVTVK